MVSFDFSTINIQQIVGLVLVLVVAPLGYWNMKRIQRKKLEEEDQFASMGTTEIQAPVEGSTSEVPGTQETPATSTGVSPEEVPLKTYIEQYKSQYSKEALRSALLNNGYDQDLVNTCLEKYF